MFKETSQKKKSNHETKKTRNLPLHSSQLEKKKNLFFTSSGSINSGGSGSSTTADWSRNPTDPFPSGRKMHRGKTVLRKPAVMQNATNATTHRPLQIPFRASEGELVPTLPLCCEIRHWQESFLWKESALETSPAFFFTATLYLKLCCANSAKSKKRLIAKINIGGFLGKPQSYTPSSHCPTTMVWIPEQKASSFSSDVLEPTFKEEEPFRSTTLTSHVSNWLFRLACLDQRTNAASGRIIPQLQLWASLNSWRNGEGHLRSFRYSYRQGLSTADTSWDHDLKDLSCREKKLPNNLEFPTLKREKKPKNLDHFRQMSIPNKTTNYQHLPKKKT